MKSKYQYFESCRSCIHHFKNKEGLGLIGKTVRMCARDRQIKTTEHMNQNGHVVKKVTAVIGVDACINKTAGRRKCKEYLRNPNKPLERQELE